MIDPAILLFGWSDIEHDLHEEDGYIFGVELDLSNNQKYYYCKTVDDNGELYQYLKGDALNAINQFNAILETNSKR